MAFHDLHELVKERSPRQHLAGYRCRPGDMASEMALLRPDRRRNRFAEKRWSDPKHVGQRIDRLIRSEEHTSELQSLMRISSAVSCLNKQKQMTNILQMTNTQKYLAILDIKQT